MKSCTINREHGNGGQAIAAAQATVGDTVVNNQVVVNVPPIEAAVPPVTNPQGESRITARMSATDAALYVGISDRQMRNWIRDNTIYAESVGEGSTLYEFDQWELDAKRTVSSLKRQQKEP